MNAYELADELDRIVKVSMPLHYITESADMLRKQADRIAELEDKLSFYELKDLDTPQTNPLQQIIDDIDCLENEINRLKYDKNIYAPNRIDYLQNKLNDMQQKLKEY